MAQGAAAEPLIVCENLVRIYKVAGLEVQALQGLDLEVAPGEMLAIVGPSGSGKSTLLNILSGLDSPSAGRIRVGDLDLLKLKRRDLARYHRERIGSVWQQSARNLIPYLTAQQNVELPMLIAARNVRASEARARELLEAVGLADRRHHLPGQLSGGQQQRVAIAVALANAPDLLLADEPTGEMDSATAQMIWATFRQLNRRYGLTTIIVTHDARIAGAADRVVRIRDGKFSSETVRLAHDEESAGAASGPQDPHYAEYTVLDAAGRLQVPREYLEQYAIARRVHLEATAEGILIRPTTATGETGLAPALAANAERGTGSATPDEDAPPPRKNRLLRWLGRSDEEKP